MNPVEPPPPFVPSSDAVVWRQVGAGAVAQEIFVRTSGTYGHRITAWVAIRDAGGNIRNHVWLGIKGIGNTVIDTLDGALASADEQLRMFGCRGEQWERLTCV